MRRVAAVVLVVVLSAPALPALHAQPAAKPRLVVMLMVDGLSWERLHAWRPWFTAGLKRLMDDGAAASECRYPHLNTLTGPGHASVATGAPPRVHGIPSNQWFVRSASGAAMEAVYSASQPAPGSPENASTTPGPGRLRVPTLADRLSMRDPSARVVSVANKDRAAILLAGRDPRHAVYWYKAIDGTYETSTVYDRGSPEGAAAATVVLRFNREKAGARLADRFGTAWARMPAPSPAPSPGFESGLDAQQNPYLGPSFPHDLTHGKNPLPEAFLSTSFADRLLTDLAMDLIADDAVALGRDDVPDLLAVSFSAHDFVSHDYGPESVEALEVLRALDLSIGRLLDDLATRFGEGSVLVAFSADHGFLPLAEASKHRVTEVTLLAQLNAAVNAKLGRAGGAPLVYRLEGCSLWLDRVALAAPGAPDPRRVLEIVRHELATTFKDAVAETMLPGDHAREARNSYVAGRSGDLFVVPRFGVLLNSSGLGTSHGSPWEYDAHVPMIFWGGGVRARVFSTPSTPYDAAPTLASWLGIELPDATGTRLSLWK